MESMIGDVNEVCDALSLLRIPPMIDEYTLQAIVGKALQNAHISYQKEYRLGHGMRVDFMTDLGTVIEIKKGKPNRQAVLSQIARYSECDEVSGVVVVIETGIREPFESFINKKLCRLIGLSKNWGVAL